MSLSLKTPPADEPVTLADAKAYLKIDTPDDDALVTSLITAARARVEWHTGRALMTQGWTLWLDGWPNDCAISIPLPPLRSVTTVTLYACDDTASVLDPARYIVDLASNRLALRANTFLPTSLRAINAIAVDFQAGYGTAQEVPQPLKVAMLGIVAFLYEHRGEAPAELPQDVQAMLAPYRMLKL